MATERRARARNRNSAKRAGAKFEIDQAALYRETLGDPRIDRQPKNGTKDLGDIAGLTVKGIPLVIECKNTSSVNLTGAMREAEAEARNLDETARYGPTESLPVVVHKRHGVSAPGEQWATMKVSDFLRIIAQ